MVSSAHYTLKRYLIGGQTVVVAAHPPRGFIRLGKREEGGEMTEETASANGSAQTVVLIHGLWLAPLSWEHWIDRYEDLGYRVVAPTWPGMDADIEALCRDPSAMAGVGITEITDRYDGIIRKLDTPPIIMGHSFGGLVT